MSPPIHANMKVADLLEQFPHARDVLDLFGIDPSEGDKDLAAAAKHHNAPVDAVLAALDEAIPTRTSSPVIQDWSQASPADVIDYVLARHHTFMKRQMPHLSELLAEAVRSIQLTQIAETLRSIRAVLDTFRTDIDAHMFMEEQTLFPWVRQAWQMRQGRGDPPPNPWSSWQEHPLYQMEYEHQRSHETLATLAELTDSYTPPEGADETIKKLYTGLAELDADLREHIRLENDYLWPVRPRKPEGRR